MKKQEKLDFSAFRGHKPSPEMRKVGEAFANALNQGAIEDERKRQAKRSLVRRLLGR